MLILARRRPVLSSAGRRLGSPGQLVGSAYVVGIEDVPGREDETSGRPIFRLAVDMSYRLGICPGPPGFHVSADSAPVRLQQAHPAAGPLITAATAARDAPSWQDGLRLLDCTPVSCGASRETVRRSALAG
jgi:hypothetical protein